jgi:hypothetical protein
MALGQRDAQEIGRVDEPVDLCRQRLALNASHKPQSAVLSLQTHSQAKKQSRRQTIEIAHEWRSSRTWTTTASGFCRLISYVYQRGNASSFALPHRDCVGKNRAVETAVGYPR